MAKGDTWTCLRCDGTWVQRSDAVRPLRCGKKPCQSPYWDKPRIVGRDSQEPELPDEDEDEQHEADYAPNP